MRLRKFVIFLILTSAAWLTSMAAASPFTFNLDGVISDSGNLPLEAPAVTFRVEVKNPAEDCLLYREDFSVSMTGSKGYFSLVVGKNANLVPGGAALDKIFSNRATAIAGQSCSYTPASASDARKVIVSFNDGTGSQVFSTQEIQSVPFALQAQAVNGYGTGDLLKVDSSVQQGTHANSDLSQAQYDEFWRLVKNPLAAYLPVTGDVSEVSGNNKLSSLLGQALPTGPATNGQALVSNGTAWVLQSLSSGSVASVSGTAPLVVSGTAMAPVVSLPAATTLADGYLTASDWNTFNSKLSSGLTSGKILVGNASGGAAEVTLSGDATLSNSGALTLKGIGTAGTYGSVSSIPVITTDAQGRVTGVTSAAPVDATKLPLAGGTMTGAINTGGFDIANTGNITMATSKILGLSSNPTDPGGLSAGQVWYNSTSNVIKYYDGSAVQSLGAAGAGLSSLNGLTSATQTFAIGTSGISPAFSSATSTHTLNIPLASTAAVTAGLISKTDYDAFNAKLSVVTDTAALTATKIWIGNASGKAQEFALSGDVTMTSGGVVTVEKTQTATASKILQLDASSVAATKGIDISGAGSGKISLRYPSTATNTTLTLPTSVGSANQFLQTDGTGNLLWAAPDASSMTGTLGVVNGGTGLTSFANYSVVTSNASGGLQSTAGSVVGSSLVHTITGPGFANDLLFGMANSPANYVVVTGASSGASPTIAAAGSDANVSLSLAGKGDGHVKINSSYVERTPSSVNISSSYTIPTGYNIVRVNLNGNATLTLPQPPSGSNQVFSLTVKVQQDATGHWTLSWAGGGTSTIKWDGGTLPVPAMDPNTETIYQFLYFDTENIWYASQTWKEQ
ncbi:MAG TPA: hypothetical protein VIG33_00875 [Pseudobdellovibrionaceae bacterium]|jgi:hypothetical protein